MKTDKELVELAKQGKRRPIWDLVEKYQPRAVKWAYHNLYGIDNENERTMAAEDVAQIALEKAWINIRYCDGRFYSWLRGIVKRECANEIRRLEREKEIALADEDFEAFTAEILRGADGDLETYDMQQAIEKAIAALPKRQRDVMKLRRVGYRHKEIAEKLGISEKNAQENLRVSRMAVDKYLAEFGFLPLESDTVSRGSERVICA